VLKTQSTTAVTSTNETARRTRIENIAYSLSA
jgi:hypothetical protein